MGIIGISGKKTVGKDTVGQIIQYLTSESYKKGRDYETFIRKQTSNLDFEPHYISKWQIKKFADKLKDIICLLINCTRDELENESFKSKELGEEWYLYIVKNTYSNKILSPCFLTKEEARHWEQTQDWYEDTGGYDTSVELIKPTPRFLLQFIGTDLLRNQLHPEIWVNSLMNEYKQDFIDYDIDDLGNKYPIYGSFPHWIITDIRFPNEMEAVKKRGGITIRVNRSFNHKMGSKETGTIDLTPEHESEKALDNAEFDYVIQNNGTISDLIDKIRNILIENNLIKK